jgi:uncharacterized membrane protein
LPTLPPVARVSLLGFVSGLRSQVGLALLTTAARRGRFGGDDGVTRLLASRAALTLTGLGTVVELTADKLPVTPPRLNPGSLAIRCGTGAALGAIVLREAGRSIPLGALLGAAGAGLGSVAGQRARMLAAEHTDVPDQWWGVAEDLTATGLSLLAVSGRS